MTSNKPRVGVGVIVENNKGEVLILKRIGKHAPQYSIPGGSLELGETFEEAAIRELEEELDITIKNPKVISVTNNLETYKKEGVHFISIILTAKTYTGKPKIMEPDRHSELLWCDPYDLPKPHFDASRFGIECYLSSSFYQKRFP